MADNQDPPQENGIIQGNEFPRHSDAYRFILQVGVGSTGAVHMVSYRDTRHMNRRAVAIKSVYLDGRRIILDDIRPAIGTMTIFSHQNILMPDYYFYVRRRLWAVYPLMHYGSVLSIMMAKYPGGLPEKFIAAVLRKTLLGLIHVHRHGYSHRGVKPGNILIDHDGSVKLADLGLSASLVNDITASQGPSNSSSLQFTTVYNLVERPCKIPPYWLAPEVVQHFGEENGLATDIWSFGITALELAHGRPPVSHCPPSELYRKRFGFFPSHFKRKRINVEPFSSSFSEMVNCCLKKDPSSRPTAEVLLEFQFFREENIGSIAEMLDGMPRIDAYFNSSEYFSTTGEIIEVEEEADIDTENTRIEWNFNQDTCRFDLLSIPTSGRGDTVILEDVWSEDFIRFRVQGTAVNRRVGAAVNRNMYVMAIVAAAIVAMAAVFSGTGRRRR